MELLQKAFEVLENSSDIVDEVKLEGDSVHVNYMFAEAVVVDVEGDHYQLWGLAWDRTHGVSAEYEIGTLAVAEAAALPAMVKAFIDRQFAEQERMEALMMAVGE